MANDRQTMAPANTGGTLDGTATLNDISSKIEKLYRYALIPLTTITGTNAIKGDCRVTLYTAQLGNQFQFLPANVNTGNVTLNPNSLGAKPLRDASGAELPSGYLSTTRIETCIDMGSEYRLTLPAGGVSGASTMLRAVFAFRQAAGTNGGAVTVGARTRYPFNTVVSNTIPGLSLDTVTNIGRIQVPARAFEKIEARCMFRNTNATAIYLYNVSDAADIANQAAVSIYDHGHAFNTVKATFAATKNIELRYICAANPGTGGLGVNVNDPGGMPEQYGLIELTSYA